VLVASRHVAQVIRGQQANFGQLLEGLSRALARVAYAFHYGALVAGRRTAQVIRRARRTSIRQVAAAVPRVLVRAMLISSVLTASVALAVVTIPSLLGMKTMVVTSGSMEPAIHVGDAALIKPVPPEAIRVGDVVTYAALEGKGTTTHRVVGIKEIKGRIYFQTKGDANATPDPNLTYGGAVCGKVSLTFLKGGYFLRFIMMAWGKAIIIGVPLLMLMVQEVYSLLSDEKRRLLKRVPVWLACGAASLSRTGVTSLCSLAVDAWRRVVVYAEPLVAPVAQRARGLSRCGKYLRLALEQALAMCRRASLRLVEDSYVVRCAVIVRDRAPLIGDRLLGLAMREVQGVLHAWKPVRLAHGRLDLEGGDPDEAWNRT